LSVLLGVQGVQGVRGGESDRIARKKFADDAAESVGQVLPDEDLLELLELLGLLELLVPEVLKIQCHPKIFPSQELDHGLQIILLLSGDPDLAILKLALDI
jgi:hypothetical protein